MKGIDTNILVRFLTGDDVKQTQKVYALFKQCEQEKGELFVPILVILELVWVLESAYETPRNTLVEAISDLILMPILKFEHQAVLQNVIHAAKQDFYDLSDLLIAHSAKAQGCTQVITLDKQASKHPLFELA